MAYIRKLPSGEFQATVRLKGLRPLYYTFSAKTKARQWALSVKSDTALARSIHVGNDLTVKHAVRIESNTG